MAALLLAAPAGPAQGAAPRLLPLPGPPAEGACRTDYRISARVDTETMELEGEEWITWTNRTTDAASDLWFHLYLNAFANDRSTHLVGSGGKARGRDFKASWGWSEVTLLRLDTPEGEVDLLPTLRWQRPDDGNEDDHTVFSVDLPRPVGADETVRVRVGWRSELPRVRRRTGHKDGFMLVAQWFPKLGVWEQGRGWNCHQFHATTEWYSNFGTYDVEIDLPAEYEGKVFGSGARTGAQTKQGRVVTTFQAPSPDDRGEIDHTGRTPVVHDFTWTADPDFVVETITFRPSEWLEEARAGGEDPDGASARARQLASDVAESVRAFGGAHAEGLRDVEVTVLVQPERAEQLRRHYDATAAALFYYGLWYGGYPYERVTVVDPPWGGRGAGGMEYPTLITCGTKLFTTPDMYEPESVTVHEAGHQWFYGLVGNNEFEAAWLDEGLNSYTDSEVLFRTYGPRRLTTSYARVPVHGVRAAARPGGGWLEDVLALREIPLPVVANLTPQPSSGLLDWWREQPGLTAASRTRDPRWGDRTGYLRAPSTDPIDTNGWEYAPGPGGGSPSYRTNSYPRPAVVLRTLEGLIGREAFLRGMRHFSEHWRYSHPYPDDFFRDFQVGAGMAGELDWFFDELFRGTGTVDWSVRVEQRREPSPAGWFRGEDGELELLEADDPEEGEEDPDDERPWRVDVVFERQGELRLPLDVRLTFEDGTVEEFTWGRDEQAERRWLRHRFTSEMKLVSVELDPEDRYWIDTDRSNDAWFDETDEVAPLRWSERVFSQYLHLLHWQARIGG
jgi:hypothetical protein